LIISKIDDKNQSDEMRQQILQQYRQHNQDFDAFINEMIQVIQGRGDDQKTERKDIDMESLLQQVSAANSQLT